MTITANKISIDPSDTLKEFKVIGDNNELKLSATEQISLKSGDTVQCYSWNKTSSSLVLTNSRGVAVLGHKDITNLYVITDKNGNIKYYTDDGIDVTAAIYTEFSTLITQAEQYELPFTQDLIIDLCKNKNMTTATYSDVTYGTIGIKFDNNRNIEFIIDKEILYGLECTLAEHSWMGD